MRCQRVSVDQKWKECLWPSLWPHADLSINVQGLFMDETVDGIPPLPLPISGQGAEKRKRKASGLAERLLADTADLSSLLELAMAAEHHPAHKHLEKKRLNKSEWKLPSTGATFSL